MVDVVHKTDALGINSFPEPVEEFISTLSSESVDLAGELKSRSGISELDRLEGNKAEKLAKTVAQDIQISCGQHRDSSERRTPDERVGAQIAGTVGTFLYVRDRIGLPPLSELQENGQKIRFNIATMSGGNTLYLLYPGDKAFWDGKYNHPFDFKVFLEGHHGVGKESEMPGHNELFSDLWWKLKESHLSRESTQLVNEWRQAMTELYSGKHPEQIITDHPTLSECTVGRIPAVLFHVTYWIFLQEDLNYPRPRFDGREYTYSPVQSILDTPLSEFGSGSGHYGEPQDPDNYPRYDKIMNDIRKHQGELIPNTRLQSDTYGM